VLLQIPWGGDEDCRLPFVYLFLCSFEHYFVSYEYDAFVFDCVCVWIE
jgi:hypothetical protein